MNNSCANEHFRFQAKIGAAVKLGAGKFLNGEVDAQNAGRFIVTIANGFNWQGMSDKRNKEVEILYHTILNNCFYLNTKI